LSILHGILTGTQHIVQKNRQLLDKESR
jgi:hypothetical protein